MYVYFQQFLTHINISTVHILLQFKIRARRERERENLLKRNFGSNRYSCMLALVRDLYPRLGGYISSEHSRHGQHARNAYPSYTACL